MAFRYMENGIVFVKFFSTLNIFTDDAGVCTKEFTINYNSSISFFEATF